MLANQRAAYLNPKGDWWRQDIVEKVVAVSRNIRVFSRNMSVRGFLKVMPLPPLTKKRSSGMYDESSRPLRMQSVTGTYRNDILGKVIGMSNEVIRINREKDKLHKKQAYFTILNPFLTPCTDPSS